MPLKHLLLQLQIQWTYTDHMLSHEKRHSPTVVPAVSSVKWRGCMQNLCEHIGSFGTASLRIRDSYKCGEVSSRCWLLWQEKIAFSKAQQGDVQEKLMLSESECLTSHRGKGNSEDSGRRKLDWSWIPYFPNIFKIYVSLNQRVFPPCRLVRTASWWSSFYEISSQPLQREVAFWVQRCPRALRACVDSLYLEGILHSSNE